MLPQNWKQKFFLLGIFNKEDLYLKQNKVRKFYESVYLINFIYTYIVLLPGKAVIFCCFVTP